MKFCPIMTKDTNSPIFCSTECKWYNRQHKSCKIDDIIEEVENVNLEYIDEAVAILVENHEKLF